MEKTIRQRIKVSTSVKGVKTPECTVEITDDGNSTQELLDRSDFLVEQLDKRYPPVKEK